MRWKRWVEDARGTTDLAEDGASTGRLVSVSAPLPQLVVRGAHADQVGRGGDGGAEQLELFPLAVPVVTTAAEHDVEPAPPRTFADAAHDVLAELNDRLPLSTWGVSRVVDPVYTVLAVASGIVTVGDAFRWEDTLCRTMIASGGPRLIVDVADHPGYAETTLAQAFGIRAYTGAALRDRDGRLLGTLCGFSQEVVDFSGLGVRSWLGTLQARASELAEVLEAELELLEDQRGAERRVTRERGDELTGLPDRRGWGFLLQREEERARAYAEPSGVLLLDLGATRSVRPLRRAAAAAAAALAGRGSVVRLDGRQLGVLCTADDHQRLRAVADAVQTAVLASGCMLTSGWAVREAGAGLPGAWQQAERRLMLVRRAQTTA